ncbi:hypothetical protein Lal_00046100 [Lupinus albus]|uniref:Uncharacterized protein n=1 Tax=Lupinus albus TaxID=3870 RepID=A0A6A4PGT9_LUPAL|nr:hypothetical protein Lalb_Chr14g0375671 [Lupinus albus]KAF1886862.1 hypothetical protein Lal_00046100 [Lupinus albus]
MLLLHKTTKTQSLKKFSLVIISLFCAIYILVSLLLLGTSKLLNVHSSLQVVFEPTTIDHIVFGIASSKASWPKRKEFAKLWWKSNNTQMRGCVFVDNLPSHKDHDFDDTTLPPLCVSQDTSRFRYTYRGGLRSAIRVARIVKEIVALNHYDVRWYIFGDDDTIFFPENIVKTLSKYDHRLWYYVGAISESMKQNWFFSFGMAYGGGGFAISSSLAKVLAKVFDSCIKRYPYLYGSDARVYSCLSELGVALTLEPGFHQVDLHGNIFGLLAAHPVTPLLSLHHLESTNPIFPNMTTTKALQHLFEAANVDSQRMLQQTVCYHKQFSWTISVSWGYAIQVFPNNMLLPDVLKVQETFKEWMPNKASAGAYTFNTRPLQRDPSKIPFIFYLVNVSSGEDGIIISNYKKSFQYRSYKMESLQKMEVIKVFTNKLDLSIKQMQSPRRHCCDVLPSRASDQMEITIRECKDDELIYMH